MIDECSKTNALNKCPKEMDKVAEAYAIAAMYQCSKKCSAMAENLVSVTLFPAKDRGVTAERDLKANALAIYAITCNVKKQNPNAEDGAAKKGIHTCNVCIGEGKNVPIILVRTPFQKIDQQGTNDVVSVSAFWYIDSHPQFGNCTLGVESIKVDGVVTVEIPFIKNTKAIKKGDRLILVAP